MQNLSKQLIAVLQIFTIYECSELLQNAYRCKLCRTFIVLYGLHSYNYRFISFCNLQERCQPTNTNRSLANNSVKQVGWMINTGIFDLYYNLDIFKKAIHGSCLKEGTMSMCKDSFFAIIPIIAHVQKRSVYKMSLRCLTQLK